LKCSARPFKREMCQQHPHNPARSPIAILRVSPPRPLQLPLIEAPSSSLRLSLLCRARGVLFSSFSDAKSGSNYLIVRTHRANKPYRRRPTDQRSSLPFSFPLCLSAVQSQTATGRARAQSVRAEPGLVISSTRRTSVAVVD